MGTDTGSLARITVRHGGLPAIAVVLIAAFATAGVAQPAAPEERNLNSTGTQPGTCRSAPRQRGSRTRHRRPRHECRNYRSIGSCSPGAGRRLTQAVIDELERHGVEEQDIQTNRFSIHRSTSTPTMADAD